MYLAVLGQWPVQYKKQLNMPPCCSSALTSVNVHSVPMLCSSSTQDLLKSYSAPDIMDASKSSSGQPRKPPVMTGGTNITYYAWGAAPDRKSRQSDTTSTTFKPGVPRVSTVRSSETCPNSFSFERYSVWMQDELHAHILCNK